jgi:hypothetical protein
MMETGCVIGMHDEVLFWHEPNGRSAGSLPDDRKLWDVLWDAHQRGILAGFAHSHPGFGRPEPSFLDIETFVAIENALGRALAWWITSGDKLIRVFTTINNVRARGRYLSTVPLPEAGTTPWLSELRQRSNYKEG